MNFRHHTHMRLDGSSKISDRRDMVNDFQSRYKILYRIGYLLININVVVFFNNLAVQELSLQVSYFISMPKLKIYIKLKIHDFNM